MYAIFSYDLYPYCICAEVTKRYEDGRVNCKGYGLGRGYARKPDRLVCDRVGARLRYQIQYERRRLTEITAAFKKRGQKRINRILRDEKTI